MFRPGQSGNPAGKPKGAQNRMTRLAKDAIALAAEELGGTDRLVAWAKEDPVNERLFWSSIYPKLLPLNIGGADGLKKLVIEWQDRPSSE